VVVAAAPAAPAASWHGAAALRPATLHLLSRRVRRRWPGASA